LVGLAVIAAMPIAGSSAAWSQNADGNVALSLGLVVASTLLSPLTTPLALTAVSTLAPGDPASALREMGGRRAGAFLLAFVVVPSAAGLLTRGRLGRERFARHKPGLKRIGSALVLALCYVNACTSLPRIVRHPDWDFLAVVGAVTSLFCALAFAS